MRKNRYGGDNSALAGLRVRVHVFAPPSSEQKWQPSAALSDGDTTHANVSGGCGSFNCVSALNDGDT